MSDNEKPARKYGKHCNTPKAPNPNKTYGWVYKQRPHSEGGNWEYKKKVEAVSSYMITGNLSLTSKLVGVPYKTLKNWKAQPWWDDYTREVATAQKVETNNKVKKISTKAMDVVMDRLENGNYQYDQRAGKMVRVPVNARDAQKIAVDMLDREAIIEERIQRLEKAEEIATKDQLADLAAQFAKFASGAVKLAQKEHDIIDITAECNDAPPTEGTPHEDGN